MKTSSNGIRFLQSQEGYSAQVYNDNGKQAIGYGHDLLPGESFPGGLTQQQATDLLIKDLESRFEPAVNSLIPPDCTQNQFDALLDFEYNLGIGSLRTMIQKHGWHDIPNQILRWNHVNGVVNPGLTARRQAELALFNS